MGHNDHVRVLQVRPHRRHRGRGRLTTKPAPRTPRPRQKSNGGPFLYTYALTANDAVIINLSVREHLSPWRVGYS